jgi:hypothetical protein
VRVSGEPTAAPFLSRMCAPNEPGVELPAATSPSSAPAPTSALATPEHPDPNYAPVYARVLAAGQSQVTAMEALNPKIVSVELGANEILGARDGAYVPGQTVVPVAFWQPRYQEVVARVAAHGAPRPCWWAHRRPAQLPGVPHRWRAVGGARHLRAAPRAGERRLRAGPGRGEPAVRAVRVPLAAAGAQGARRGAGCRRRCSAARTCRRWIRTARPPRLRALAGGRVAQANAHAGGDERGDPGRGRPLRLRVLRAVGAVSSARCSAAVQRRATMLSPTRFGPLGSLDGCTPSAAGHAVLAGAAAHALQRDLRLRHPDRARAGAPLAAVLAGR